LGFVAIQPHEYRKNDMLPFTRREFMLNIPATAVLAACATTTPSVTAMTQSSSAFATIHEAKPLPFDPSKLDGLSEKLIRSHWENNYGGSVKALNTIKQRLAAALDDSTLPPFVYNDLKREHLMRTGSVVLHELYFGNLGGAGRGFWQL
jgi:Fe-Mn family superoxide dismutase